MNCFANILPKFSLVAISALSIASLLTTDASAATTYQTTVVASNLNNPRGIAIAPDGKVYVAEAGNGGNGPSIISGSGMTVYFGQTGAIGVYDPLTTAYNRPIAGFPSLAALDNTDGTGIGDLYFDTDGNLFGVIGFGANPTLIPNTGNSTFGHTIAIDLNTASYALKANIAAYELTYNPDQINTPPGDVNSNPYALVVRNGITYVSDAGGNDLLSANASNTVSLISVFPTQLVTPPPFLPLPNPFLAQAVPTGLALGRDNTLYIAQLSGFPFVNSSANIYRYDFTNPATIFASGFSNITDIAVGLDNSLYILQYSANFFAPNPSGSIWQLKPDGTRTEIVTGLNQPTGIAISPNGRLYVANNGNGISGELLEITPVPEPQMIVGLLVAVGLGMGINRQSGQGR